MMHARSDRRLVLTMAVAVALCCSVSSLAQAEDAAAPAMSPMPAAKPAPTMTPVKGEFDNFCAEGLASGQLVKTDCSISWTAPDGKVYCFALETSKEAFLKNPDENIRKAREFLLTQAHAAASGAKTFTEDDVNAAVKKTIDAKTKDGAFVFHDPKLDADLNLLFDQIKIVRGMTGYGWFANVIFHDKDEPKKQYAIDFWFKPDGDQLRLMDIRVQKGPKQEGDGYVMITRSPVAWWWLPVSEHPGDAEDHPRLAGDGRHPRLHRHP
jgi:hypothetical protein